MRRDTWILIADGARARVFQYDGPGKRLKAVEGWAFQGDHRATHEIMSDREGRVASSVGSARSALQAHYDPHRELKRHFAGVIADALDRALTEGMFDRLIIVAEPTSLGDLRAALPERVRHKVTAELARDLTKTPDAELPDHLKKVLRM